MDDRLNNMPVIDCGDFILRQLEFDDYKDMFDYGGNAKNTVFLGWGPYKSIDDAIWAAENVFLARPESGLPVGHAIVWKENNKMIGTCDIHTWNKEEDFVEIGYVVHMDYWNKGIATKACLAVMEYAFNDLGVSRIEIAHHKDNIGSKRVIEKCGFSYLENREHPTLPKDETMPFYEMYK